MQADIGGATVSVSRWKQAGGFEQDISGVADKTCQGGKRAENVMEGIAEAIVETVFAEFGAAKEVVTVGVKNGASSAKAARPRERGRQDRETEFAGEQE